MSQASERVLCDLVNALFHENVLGFAERGVITESLPGAGVAETGEGELYFQLELADRQSLVFRMKRHRFIQPLKISRPPVWLATADGEMQEIGPMEMMAALAHANASASVDAASCFDTLPNLQGFLEELQDAIEQSELSHSAYSLLADEQSLSMIEMERLSAFRDRPFHPTARAKRGWSLEEYRRYSPEFGQSFPLVWVAVRREFVQQGQHGEIAPLALTASEQERLMASLEQAGLSAREYLTMPVHPWQMARVLPEVFQAEIERGIVVPLGVEIGAFRATSSLRALVPADGGRRHVKVPIGIYSLAALRILPPRYLHNAEKAQAVLAQVIAKDAKLTDRLHLCDEQNWWGYHDPDADPFGDQPGHLACVVREYPQALLEEGVDLVAMSTLAVVAPDGNVPAVEHLLKKRGDNGEKASAVEQAATKNGASSEKASAVEQAATKNGASSEKAPAVERSLSKHEADGMPDKQKVLDLFADIARAFLEMSLTCFRYGLMPEVHGQNVMLAFEKGRVTGLLLRDHDTVRLHLPWLTREGFEDPAYIVKPGTPNSLVNETPHKLLSYFQTLGLQVNLYAIVDALVQGYGIEESECWQVIREILTAQTQRADLPDDVRDVLHTHLLSAEKWPTRTLIGPLLRRVGSGGGSMPADSGETANPLRALEG